jgi:toxin ParE1/3/4
MHVPVLINLQEKKMRYLADNPKYGLERDEIQVGYLSCFEGSHTIYYRIMTDHIDIIDVLYQSMEPKRHLFKEE